MAYDTILEEGAPLPQQTKLNVLGTMALAEDNPVQARTDLYIGYDPAKTLRLALSTLSPHITLTGDAHLTGNLGVNTPPAATSLIKALATGSLATDLILAELTVASLTLTGNGRTFRGLAGSPLPNFQPGSTGHFVEGLNYVAACSGGGTGTVVANVKGIAIRAGAAFFTGTLTALYGMYIETPNIAAGNPAVTLSTGVHIRNVGISNKIVDAISLRLDDITANTGYRYLIEAGPATPYLRLIGGAIPGANLTNLYLGEGNPNTLRRVQWVDPGNGGVNLVAGQRVMILV